MALVAHRAALFRNVSSLLVQAKRFRGKINIRKPKPPHFEREKFIELTKPWFLKKNADKTMASLCIEGEGEGKKWARPDNPYQRILAQELLQKFNSSRLIGFYHQNSMNAATQTKARVAFFKAKMHLGLYGKKTLEMAVNGTKFEPVLQLHVSQNYTVFSPEPDIKTLLKVSKRFPQIVLLAAIFEGKFISRDELMNFSQIPNLQTAQAGLVQVLNNVGGTLVSHLESHQQTLVKHLENRMKQLDVSDSSCENKKD